MRRRTVLLSVVVAAISGTARGTFAEDGGVVLPGHAFATVDIHSPGSSHGRARDASRSVRNACLWTESEMRRDPEGYFDAVIQTLLAEIEALKPVSAALELSVEEITKQIEQTRKLLHNARRLCIEFRLNYLQAEAACEWPVEICGKSYTKNRLQSQISRLMAQAEAFADALRQLQDCREQTEGVLEPLVQRPTRLKAQVLITQTLQRIYRAQQIPSDGGSLVDRAHSLVRMPERVDDRARLRAISGAIPQPPASPRLNTVHRFVSSGNLDAGSPKSKVYRQPDDTPIFLQK